MSGESHLSLLNNFPPMARYADVVLPLPLGDTFTYSLPDDMQASVEVGSRVIVPFGNRKFYSAVRMTIGLPMPPKRWRN